MRIEQYLFNTIYNFSPFNYFDYYYYYSSSVIVNVGYTVYPCVQYLERNSYLCTYDLHVYGPVRNVFDAFHDGGVRGVWGSSAVM